MFKNIFVIVVYLVLLSNAAISHAASTLSLVSVGDSTYQIQGDGLDGVAGFDITVNYDPTILAAPQTAQGALLSGAMLAVNANIPGVIRVNAVTLSPVKGSGQILTITFTRDSDGLGIKNLTARLINLSGQPLPSQVQLALGSNPGGGGQGESSQNQQTMVSASGTPAAGTGGSGTIIGLLAPSPSDQPAPPKDQNTNAGQELPQPQSAAATPAVPAQPASPSDQHHTKPKILYTQPSVLDRFRDFQGKRTMKTYLELFDQEPLIGFRQEPAVALADGISTLTVRYISTPGREYTSDIALKGATLIASRRDPQSTNTWIVTILPEKGSDSVTLSVPQNDLLMVFPLTIAPKIDIDLDKSGSVDEKDFALFLRNRGTRKKPKFDLNGDGVRDYRDDYIFAANYIFSQQHDRKNTTKRSRNNLNRDL